MVGASADVERIGGQPIRALTEFGYRGKVYPVNPRYREILGLRCYPDVLSVPQPCDVALVVVAARLVPRVIEQCGEAGIPFAVVLSSGFGEIGERGEELQARLGVAIERSGVRVVGPNCQGLLNLKDRIYNGFGAIFQTPDLDSGPVAMVTQSGGFGYAVVGLAEHYGVGFNYIASTGNETDVNTLDLLSYFLEREDIEVVVTYMEGVKDGRRLRDVGVRSLEAGKPVLVWKVGNSGTGQRAAASHTANLVASYELYRAAFREGGFIEVGDVDELVDVTQAFRAKRLPEGENVAVITVSGGAGVLVADRCEERGLKLPPLSPETTNLLREAIPYFGSADNPVDVTGQVFNDLDMFNKVTSAVLADPAVHQVVVCNASLHGEIAVRFARELAEISRGTDKPILVAWSVPPGRADKAMQILEEERVPCYLTPVRAATTAAALHQFASRRRTLRNRHPHPRLVGPRPLDLPWGKHSLGEHHSKKCLEAYGIPIVREVLLPPEEAEGIAAVPLEFPVAVKVESPDIPHKTEAGVVRLGVGSVEELRGAVHEILDLARRFNPEARIERISVQEMVSGLEVIAGAVNDPFFGPVLVFGLGGVFAEALRDVTHRLAPFGTDVAQEMIWEVKGSTLFDGFRGNPPLDVGALAEVLSRLSLLATDHADRIEQVDINPLFVRPEGEGIVAADALVVLRPERPG